MEDGEDVTQEGVRGNMKSHQHVSILVLAAVACGSAAATPAADRILAQSLASYDRAKTFQGEMVVTIQRGGTKSTVTVVIKAENDGRGRIARSFLTIHSTVLQAGKTVMTSQQFLDDGTALHVIDLDRKRYADGPHAPDSVSGLFRRSVERAQAISGGLAVSEDDHGPDYVLTGKSTRGSVTVLVEKQTQRLISIRWAGRDAGDMSSEVVSHQQFDKPLPPGTFLWRPPPGFTQEAETPPS